MYLHLFLLLFSSGTSSYSLPPKETSDLQNTTRRAIIDEMICLLEAENGSRHEKLLRPLHIKKKHCACKNTQTFIQELEKIPRCKCMKIVEKDMKKLKEKCDFLKKSSPNDTECENKKSDFSTFKDSLEEFLKWINQEESCRNILTSESRPYPDGNCTCPDSWKYSKGLF